MAKARDAARPVDWKAAMLSSVRYLMFGLALPLAAIHLWIATARGGLGFAIRKSVHYLARAFAPQSVLIYIVGFLIFGVAPYLLLFRTTPTKHAWLEISLLVARLAIVFALTLFGWVITVRAPRLSVDKRAKPACKRGCLMPARHSLSDGLPLRREWIKLHSRAGLKRSHNLRADLRLDDCLKSNATLQLLHYFL